MNDTNLKIVDVRKAFDALPQKGRLVECGGKTASNFDFNTHIRGLAAYRTFHLVTYSEFNVSTGRLLVVDRTPAALYCTGFRYDDGGNLNEFRAAPPKPAVAPRRAAGTVKQKGKAKTRASKRRRPATK